MCHTKTVRSVAFLFVPLVFVASSRAAPADDAVAKASADFQQAAYEFALHLAVGQPGTATRAMQDTWRQLSVLRRRACPSNLRRAVNDATHNLGEGLDQRLDVIEAELNVLAKETDVAEARAHLAAARDALKAKQPAKVQSECLVVMDAVVGRVVDIPLVQWVEGLRKARSLLGDNPSPQRMAAAFDVLRGLEGVERFRPKAFQDLLGLAYEQIASATELYEEGDFRNAAEQLGRAEVPLQLAGRASKDPEVVRRLSGLWRQLRRADKLIVTDIDLARTSSTEGFRLLEEAQSEISEMLAKGIQP